HELKPVVDAGVGEQHARSAGPRDNHNVLAPGRRHDRYAAGEFKHLVEPTRADDAALAQHVVVYFVVAGQRRRVRARGPRAERGAARLEHDHRLGFRYPARDLGKGAAILEVLDVHRDDLGVVILLEEGEEVVLVDVGLVAESDDGGDAHFGRAAEAHDRHPNTAALRGKRGLPLYVVGGAERGAQVFGRVVKAVDVWPHQAHAVPASHFHHLVLQRDVAGFGEARRDQDGAGDLLLA